VLRNCPPRDDALEEIDEDQSTTTTFQKPDPLQQISNEEEVGELEHAEYTPDEFDDDDDFDKLKPILRTRHRRGVFQAPQQQQPPQQQPTQLQQQQQNKNTTPPQAKSKPWVMPDGSINFAEKERRLKEKQKVAEKKGLATKQAPVTPLPPPPLPKRKKK